MKVNKLNVGNERELRDCLDSLYTKAKEKEDFFGLLELITNKETFLTAIHNIKSNKGSKTAGIDRKIVDDYLKMDKVNKVHNLASVCKPCHALIHNDKKNPFLSKKSVTKLTRYRKIIMDKTITSSEVKA